MYLGAWKLEEYLPIPITTNAADGSSIAPTALSYSIYEEATTIGIKENVSINFSSPFDSITGLYLVRVQLRSTLGFEAGKNYIVVIKATVDGINAIATHVFQITNNYVDDLMPPEPIVLP